MTSEKDDKKKNVIDGGRILDLYRPAVKQLADLHLAGKIHGAIRPESVVAVDHIRFCFFLSEEDKKGYNTEQKIFVSLRLSNKKECSREYSGNFGGVHISRRSPYIPLEQLIDGEKADARSDVYSLCAVLYQFITGMEPSDVRERIDGAELKKPSELGIEISFSQEAALLKGLEEMRKNRYVNGEELYRALYGANTEKRKTDKKRRGRKKNALRSGWTVKDDVKEIEKLRTVTFLDYIPQTKEKKWDVSAKKDGSVLAWMKEKDGKYDLYIGSDGVIVAGENCSQMFFNCTKLKSINFGENFDTENTRYMLAMFGYCSALEFLDVTGLDTSQVKDMSWMFYECSSLEKLDVSCFNTSRAEDMHAMFYNCSSLSKLDVSGFDTSRVTDTHSMFYNCTDLIELDVSGFNTSQVKDMSGMFYGCSALEELNVKGFDISHAEKLDFMFYNCVNLKKH
ncbi:MAG TPA: BspA family leucine-rich repeat surface protein [Candidatus Scybalocola faecigallinarum]|uniref:BspA family leucine-rich repeat surface protein n=1 Tax=Candidatus Scybalocola faecigallinarum TaxID=2840941 RepID=A0A9D1F3G6_9FIRM|nr:BspA family leucine-rich repeat surface protein [Candidatus Scybalocola faecigallinarum]